MLNVIQPALEDNHEFFEMFMEPDFKNAMYKDAIAALNDDPEEEEEGPQPESSNHSSDSSKSE